ncbi:MAG: FapA family protein, partial [Desulfobacula sp.]|nr:FapA family protein [Desulfobacula sp.]
QKNSILKEQDFVDAQAEKIFSSIKANKPVEKNQKDIALSEYEKQFLHIKALDKEFAASLIEKKIASMREIRIAQKVQEDEFDNKSELRILGDIMVELTFLTEDQKNQILKEQEAIGPIPVNGIDKKVHIFISSDRMEAVVEIKKDVKNLSLTEIKEALKAKGILYGIYPDTILQCNLDIGNNKFTAARQGLVPELIKQKKTVYHFDIQKIDKEQKIKGTALAEQSLSNETLLIEDLFGHAIETDSSIAQLSKPSSDPARLFQAFRCAAGVRLSKDKSKAFAGKTGFPSLSIEHKLFVHPAINVLEDADLRYGPLEQYANLKVSGVVTGAYPVTSGDITAREIRGAHITAIGNVTSLVGITDAVIIAQGDIHAGYLHNCRIETFGNVYIENEILDSQIFCSGKIDSGKCHIISSTLYGKKGVEIAGAGNSKTDPCIIGAGTEHHILERVNQITLELKKISRRLDELKENRNEQIHFAKKSFQKMIELKIFHDRAKKKKEKLSEDFKKKKNTYKKEKLENIVRLINNFDKRKTSSLVSLKKLNKIKKKYDREANLLKEKIKKITPEIKRNSLEFETDIAAFFEWTRKQDNICKIKINKEVYQGTVLKGVFSYLVLEKNKNNFSVFEKLISKNHSQLVIKKI